MLMRLVVGVTISGISRTEGEVIYMERSLVGRRGKKRPGRRESKPKDVGIIKSPAELSDLGAVPR
jgi:hypothetical protein